MLYESLAMTMRMKLYERLETGREDDQSYYRSYVNGFAVGSLVQYITNPLYKLNIANHNYKLGD